MIDGDPKMNSQRAKQKRGRGPDKRKRSYPKNRKPGCGAKPFVPTPAERAFVHAMSGLKMTHQEIAAVIGAGRGADGMTGKPISPNTLAKHFKRELEAGPSLLRAKVTGNYYRALEQGEAWATQAGLRNRFNWDAGRGGFDGTPTPEGQPELDVHVEFVVPGHKPQALPVPQWDPAPEGQKLLPPPPRRRLNELGVWVEE